MNKAFVGVVQNRVAPNPKCTGCLHYEMNRSVCVVGLAPASCGDGSIPDLGYAPIRDGVSADVASAETPSHAVPARPGAQVPPGNPRLPVIQAHLGDESELLALAKSLASDLRKSCRDGCPLHQYGDKVYGLHNSFTAGGHCTCTPLDKSQLALDIHRHLSPSTRARLSVGVVAKWVEKNSSAF